MFLISDKENFDLFYNDLITQFPKEEQKSKKVFLKLLTYDCFDVLSAFDKAAYAFLLRDELNKVVWLDYIAVRKEFHSMGFGKKVINDMKDYYNGYKGCFLEVEKPNEAVPNTIRRIKFYENLGAKKIDCDYFYPNEQGDLQMDLYYISYDDKPVSNIFSTIENIHKLLHSDIPHLNEVLSKIEVKQ